MSGTDAPSLYLIGLAAGTCAAAAALTLWYACDAARRHARRNARVEAALRAALREEARRATAAAWLASDEGEAWYETTTAGEPAP